MQVMTSDDEVNPDQVKSAAATPEKAVKDAPTIFLYTVVEGKIPQFFERPEKILDNKREHVQAYLHACSQGEHRTVTASSVLWLLECQSK